MKYFRFFLIVTVMQIELKHSSLHKLPQYIRSKNTSQLCITGHQILSIHLILTRPPLLQNKRVNENKNSCVFSDSGWSDIKMMVLPFLLTFVTDFILKPEPWVIVLHSLHLGKKQFAPAVHCGILAACGETVWSSFKGTTDQTIYNKYQPILIESAHNGFATSSLIVKQGDWIGGNRLFGL